MLVLVLKAWSCWFVASGEIGVSAVYTYNDNCANLKNQFTICLLAMFCI